MGEGSANIVELPDHEAAREGSSRSNNTHSLSLLYAFQGFFWGSYSFFFFFFFSFSLGARFFGIIFLLFTGADFTISFLYHL